MTSGLLYETIRCIWFYRTGACGHCFVIRSPMNVRTWNIGTQRSFYGLLIGAIITVAYALLWLFERPPKAPMDRYIGFILGVEAVQFMSWSLVLATVLPFQETAFGGLDRQAIW